jgi:hypothetical protein
LHNGPDPLFHRDIHWPNLILLPNDHSKWFLINWDDAAVPPTCAAKHLNPRSHPAAVLKDNHGAEVDIWGLWKLILDTHHFLPCVSDTLVAIGMQMVKEMIGTAAEAQNQIRQST